VERITTLADELAAQRAEDRIGSIVTVLVDELDGDGVPSAGVVGRAAHQAPEVDGSTTLLDADGVALGDLVRAKVVGTDGIDLAARLIEVVPR